MARKASHPTFRIPQSPFRNPHSRPAFTLLELLITLSLLVALLALAWPKMEARLTGSELPESADRIRSILGMARAAAVTEGRRVRVRFEPNEQQPYVEIEPDPIRLPGEYVQIEQGWAEEPPLLGDVQVHEIILGRPEFLKPISTGSETSAGPQETEQGPASGASVADTGESEITNLATTPQDLKADPVRPTLVFESDGSSDWAMLVVANAPLGEPIADQIAQKWVILDGRTGLASVRDGLTQEELADPALYVSREKLELPEDNDIRDQPLAGADAMDPGMAGPSSEGGLDPLAEAMGAGMPPGSPQNPTGPLQPQPAMDPKMSQQPPPGAVDPSANPPPAEGQPEQPAESGQGDSMSELDKKLSDANLSEEEKEKIRKAFAQQGGGRK